jgi:hypothetical protein
VRVSRARKPGDNAGVTADELVPGLWHWTAPHPDWLPGTPDQLVGSYLVETPDALVLVDPLAPPAGSPAAERFWVHLDRDVERHARPVAILVQKPAHVRSTRTLLDRYPGARVYGLPGTEAGLEPGTPVEPITGELPEGISATVVVRDDDADAEAVLRLPGYEAIAVADLLMGREDGLHVWSWYEDEEGRRFYEDQHLPALRDALAGPVERVLVSHGTPVRSGGRAAIDAALERPPRSMRYGPVRRVGALRG